MKAQIIGDYKEYIVIERKTLNELEGHANSLLELDDTYSQLRGREILKTIGKIKEENIYNKDFQIKG
jgi:hypothetical protein